MAIKQNPDWHVWVGDVFYWLRTPPGIYIALIVLLGSALIYTNSSTIYSPPKTAQPISLQPQTIPLQKQLQPQPHLDSAPGIVTMDLDGNTWHDVCPPGMRYVQSIKSCFWPNGEAPPLTQAQQERANKMFPNLNAPASQFNNRTNEYCPTGTRPAGAQGCIRL